MAGVSKVRVAIEKLETKLSKVVASIDAGAPAKAPDLYPAEWVCGFILGRQGSFSTVQILGSRIAMVHTLRVTAASAQAD